MLKGAAPVPLNFSKDIAEQANRKFEEYFTWAEQVGLPLYFAEAQLRDKLSLIEGQRLAAALSRAPR